LNPVELAAPKLDRERIDEALPAFVFLRSTTMGGGAAGTGPKLRLIPTARAHFATT
jgi:hypothetical protein